MSVQELSKVISIRVPAIYFRRLGFLAYHSGELPSETARGILMNYLNAGCLLCGGPLHEIEFAQGLGICVNPPCAEEAPFDNVMPLEDYTQYAGKSKLPGFSER